MHDLFRILQLTDSAFPVGSFSFSNGLETATHLGIVKDRNSLFEYGRSAMLQSAYTDGVAALFAYRAVEKKAGIDKVIKADKELFLMRLNEESRTMLTRMGRKFAELSLKISPAGGMMDIWHENIKSGKTPGTYPVGQGIAFAESGLGEENLFICHQYGIASMILSAALRCIRISHFETQDILSNLGKTIPALYEAAREMNLESMHSFVPQMDILAAIHEKGQMRMFMN